MERFSRVSLEAKDWFSKTLYDLQKNHQGIDFEVFPFIFYRWDEEAGEQEPEPQNVMVFFLRLFEVPGQYHENTRLLTFDDCNPQSVVNLAYWMYNNLFSQALLVSAELGEAYLGYADSVGDA